jgi:hypothetical protein
MPCGRSIAARGVVATSLGMLLSGCYTSMNTVEIPKLTTRYPVSASASYVGPDRATVDESHYRPISSFSFQKTIAVDRHDTRVTVLQLGPEIDRLVSQVHGDAVTRFKIIPSYQNGDHATAAVLKQMGWLGALAGGVALAIGAGAYASNPRESTGRTGLLVGGTLALASGLSFALAASQSRPTRWSISVSGVVVRSTLDEPRPGALLCPTE